MEDNPTQLNGFEFLEFSTPDKNLLHQQFVQLGFTATAQHKTRDLTLYQQGEIKFLLNNEKNSQADLHAKQHGAGACAMGFRVANVKKAHAYVLSKGAVPFIDSHQTTNYAIEAIGGSVIYFYDKTDDLFNQFIPLQKPTQSSCHLLTIDHLTHNVHQGNMDKWAEFYIQLFNFKQIRFFDIDGLMTGLVSRAMASPCGNIKIPLNESKDEKSQIEEFLEAYHGEGIQHIALSTNDIYLSVKQLRQNGITFLDVPDTYYELLPKRISWHQENVPQLKKYKILMDGEVDPAHGLLLQIFTQTMLGPAFFEIIQRKGNQGFGEGNFQALFEAIERDQLQRGAI